MTEPEFTKHSVNTDALATLGTIIGPDEGRDAIHIAVYPVQAAERMQPGDHVFINADGKAEWTDIKSADGVGIVDPFLAGQVKPGEWFWCLVYPRQITSLRHVWEHPSFPASGPVKVVVQETSAIQDLMAEAEAKKASEQWLRAWIAEADCPDFHTTIGAMLDQRDGTSWHGDYVHFDGQDAHGEIPAEAWHHLSIYSGEDLSGDRPSWFSCSC